MLSTLRLRAAAIALPAILTGGLFGAPNASAAAEGENPRSLAGTLAHTAFPAAGLLMAVLADSTFLPGGARAPSPQAPLEEVAAAFGRTTERFGTVIAVAPQTMIRLSTDVKVAPFEHPPPADALKLLLAGLNDQQWEALTGARGLGADDLDTSWKRALFADVLPSAGLEVGRPPAGAGVPGSRRVLSAAELGSARLRLSKRLEIWLPREGDPRPQIAPAVQTRSGVPSSYITITGYGGPRALSTLSGAQIRDEVPNRPKAGGLDLSAPRLQADLPVAGLRTVGDLIDRAARRCGVELYVDPRYAAKSLTILGNRDSAPVADLLRSVALCLTGTYRAVGSAYVLTDDRVGLGTRRQMLAEVEEAAERELLVALRAAGGMLRAGRSFVDLPTRGDSVDLTPQQLDEALGRAAPVPSTAIAALDVSYSQLSAPQQDLVVRLVDQLNVASGSGGDRTSGNPPLRASLDGRFTLALLPSLELLVPTLDGPLDLDPVVQSRGLLAAVDPNINANPARELPLSVDLRATLGRYRHRAVLVKADNTLELDRILSSMRALGLNEIWLVVSAPDLPWKRSVKDPSSDGERLLRRAVYVGTREGIGVLPVVDLLLWHSNAPPTVRDQNILGFSSRDADAQMEVKAEGFNIFPRPPQRPGYMVTLFSAYVQQSVQRLLDEIARQPGTMGLVWRDVGPAGPPERIYYQPDNRIEQLGYTEASRLAFLRAAHADPVDIDLAYPLRSDTTLPEFDDPAVNADLLQKWRWFLRYADGTMLQNAYRVVAAAAGRAGSSAGPVIYIQQQCASGGWFGFWPGRQEQLPQPGDLNVTSQADIARLARSRSPTALRILSGADLVDAAAVAHALTESAPPQEWDGVVLDLDPEGKQMVHSSDTLFRLSSQASARAGG